MANPIIDRAKAHYAAYGVQSASVPEWGEADQPLQVYWSPVTLAERQKIVNRIKDGATLEAMAYALILKAQDGQGKNLFSLEDKLALMNGVDASVVERVAGLILAAPSVEDAEKN
jgi:hypothetical protein